ncbi:TetR family transcriptional regulator [Rhodococcus sp. X156]|uniref:TetR family transcriptional regulator n=1 Tax=Rhodococcus sp. X156 TaxID=2499145 RepID=UPI000FD9C368|nr:TetR family transcriptional regulator [Rhodococcus sp. X156]
MSADSLRVSYRQHLRAQALAAAHALTAEKGWDRVRVSEVAAAVGTSRTTLYNEFGDKQGLGEALVLQEADRFLTGIRDALDAHPDDVRTGITAAVQHTMDQAAASPLLKAVLTSPRAATQAETVPEAHRDGGILPLLTTSISLLELASDQLVSWLTEHLPDVTDADARHGIDAVVRLTVSHLVLPAADSAETSHQVAEVAIRYFRL